MLVDLAIGRGGIVQSITMGDERRRVQRAQHLPRDCKAARLVPAPTQRRVDGAYLAADQAQTAAVKAATQVDGGALGAIPIV